MPDGDEKQMLHVALDRHRDVVVWKLQGLDDEQLRRPMTPSGTSALGVVKHLASVENGWFCSTFARPSEELPYSADDPDADWRIEPHESTDDVLAYYDRARAAADRTVDELELHALGDADTERPVSLRWVLVHMVEETARHAGHLDILRELLDGQAGDHAED